MQLGIVACATLAVIALSASARGAEDAPPPSSFSVLSYNVRGLPSAGNLPRQRFSTIGWLADAYDLVLNQEVFASAGRLAAQMKSKEGVAGVGLGGDPGRIALKVLLFPFTFFVPDLSPPYGSGLYTFVGERLRDEKPLDASEIETMPYRECYGSFSSGLDCFARKGYLRVGITAPEGIAVDVYNTHLDAGNDDASRKVRLKQLLELACAIEARDSGRPVIVAGDLNTGYGRKRDRYPLALFRDHLGLADSGAGPELQNWRERDYILYRDGRDARLVVERSGEDRAFVRDGYALSDHPALFAVFHAERDSSGSHTPMPRHRIDCPPAARAGAS